MPHTFYLSRNYPNPFNPTTDIGYHIAEVQPPVHTTLIIYNLLGQEVKTLVDEVKAPGYYTVNWDGRDGSGQAVSSGVYFYTISAGEFFRVRKMVLMR